jgi:hypothetical protein
MSVAAEAYAASSTRDYYAGKVDGWSDPAGNYLAEELTGNYQELEKRYPDLTTIKTLSGAVGIIMWAKEHNIVLDRDSQKQLDRDFTVSRKRELEEKHPWSTEKEENGKVLLGLQVEEDQPPITEADLKPPMRVFGQYGVTRFLWEDGSSSTIGYDSHEFSSGDRIMPTSLQSRNGSEYHIFYDKRHQLVGIVNKKTRRGVVAFKALDPPAIVERVVWPNLFDVAPGIIEFARGTTLAPVMDAEALLQGKLLNWYDLEAEHKETDTHNNNWFSTEVDTNVSDFKRLSSGLKSWFSPRVDPDESWLFGPASDWRDPSLINYIIVGFIGVVTIRTLWHIFMPELKDLTRCGHNYLIAFLICLASGILGGFVGKGYVVAAIVISCAINLFNWKTFPLGNPRGWVMCVLWICYSVCLATLTAAMAGLVTESPFDYASELFITAIPTGAAVGFVLYIFIVIPKDKETVLIPVAIGITTYCIHSHFDLGWGSSFVSAGAIVVAIAVVAFTSLLTSFILAPSSGASADKSLKSGIIGSRQTKAGNNIRQEQVDQKAQGQMARTSSRSHEPKDFELMSMAELDSLIRAPTTPLSVREGARTELSRRERTN